MKTAFIAGATGYTGREVVRAWRALGHPAVAHVRPDSSQFEAHRARFEALGAAVDTTPWEEEALREALAQHTPAVIFCLLGTTKKRAARDAREGRDSSYEAVDYGLTAMLLRAAAALERPPRIIYLSSIGVGARRPRNAYLEARWRVEQALREGSLPWTVARPSFISGPDRGERRPAERVGAIVGDVALGALSKLGAGRLAARYRSQTAAALAGRLTRLALDEAAVGRAFEADELSRA